MALIFLTFYSILLHPSPEKDPPWLKKLGWVRGESRSFTKRLRQSGGNKIKWGFPLEAGRNQGGKLTFLFEERGSQFRSPSRLSALVMSAPVAFSRRTLQPSAGGREGGGALLTKESLFKSEYGYLLSALATKICDQSRKEVRRWKL